MKDYAIVTDSACDITAEVLKEWPCFSCGVSNGLSGEPEGKRGSIF